METLKGKVLSKFGSHISTDDMTSGKYIVSHVPEEVAKICMKDIDPDFPQKMKPGGFLVAEKNFGCGSSRETATIAVQAAGTHAIIAEEFARIFYRNAFNIGMPCIECPGIHAATDLGDELEIDMSGGWVINRTKGTKLKCIPVPDALIRQIEAKGLIPLLRQRIAERKQQTHS
jgi:3-isopropylmalate/(R)-2-methylmalate dehydratase small subunit